MSHLSNRITVALFALITIVSALGTTQARSQSLVDPTPAPWVAGYYVAYQRDLLTPDEIDWNGLTHIIMARVLANPDGTLNTNFDWDATHGPALARDIATRAHSHGKKAILMLGGDDNGAVIHDAVANHRAAFIANLVAAMTNLGYDGIDLDWENNIDWNLFKLFAAELRQAAPQAILTLPGGPLNINYDTVEPRLVEVITHIDQFNLMSYYPATSWVGSGWYSWYNSPLSGAKSNTPVSIEDSFNRYVAAGIPKSKLGMGVGFYATCYTGGITAPNQSTESGVQIFGGDNEYPLSEIYSSNGAYDESMRRWDSEAKQPYLSLTQPERHGCRYVSIEDEDSLIAKGDFTRTNGYGGIIIWTMNQGQVRSHSKPNFLFEALRKGFIEPDLVRNVGISVMQGDLWLERNATIRLSALVTGATDKRVQWSVATPNCGSIDATGVYSAPSIDSNCTIHATSLADASMSATAQITVTNATWTPQIGLSRLGTHWLEVTAMDEDVASMSVGLSDGSSFALTLHGRTYGTNYPIFATNYAFPENGSDYTFYVKSRNNRKTSAVLHVPQCVHGDDGLCSTGQGSVVSLNRSSVTFAGQRVGTTSAAQSVLLSNTGAAALTISSITASGDFSVSHNCGSGLGIGGFCNLNVSFAPTADSVRNGAVTITSNASGSPHALNLSGTGISQFAPLCSLSAAPDRMPKGRSAVLTATCNPAATSYTWTGGTCAGTTAATCTVSPTATIAYGVTGINNFGSSTAGATVRVTQSIAPILYILLD